MDIQFYEDEIKRYQEELERHNCIDATKMDKAQIRELQSKRWYFTFSIKECQDNIERLKKVASNN